MSDTRQNQLAKCPNSTLCSKEKFSRVHTCGLTQSWSSSAHSDASFHSTKEKGKLAASVEQGRNREDPQNKWFWQLLRTSPQIPLSGSESHKQWAHCNHLGTLSWPWLYSGKHWGARCRESAAPRWAQKMLAAQKSVKRQVWWKGKFALFWIPAMGWGRVDSCPKADSPLLTIRGQELLLMEGGVTCRNSTVNSDNHLEIGHVVVCSASSWLF